MSLEELINSGILRGLPCLKKFFRIVPKLSPGDLSSMGGALTTRFGKIAKKFGKGLLEVITGGGVAGLALGIIDKLLNPLKETQDAIDRMLVQGNDIVTNAKQFGTTAGKLARLQALGKSVGLDPESLERPAREVSGRRLLRLCKILLNRFQFASLLRPLAPAGVDDNGKPIPAIPRDTAESFFEFTSKPFRK